MLGSINDASIQPYQGLKGVQESIRRNQQVHQPFAPSGGAHLASGANGTPAVPATMVMSASTGDGGSSKHHYHFDPQATNAHPLCDGLVHLGPPTSSTGATAYSSYPYSFCPLSDSWAATPFDVWAPRPTPQAVVSQMNIVTPYTSYDHDGGGTSVDTAVCVAASSAPGPTRNITGACDTALSDRTDAVKGFRNPHRCVDYDQMHKVPTRRATRPSSPRATKGPVVRFEADANALATRLLIEGADSTAVELLCSKVFNDEVSARALTVKTICREQSISRSSSTRSKYRLLLADVERKDGSNGYCCLLCPQGRRKEYKNPQDSIRHLRKAHFGIADPCIGWYVAIPRVEPQSKEN